MKVKLWGFLLITLLAFNCSNLKREKDVITSSNTSVVNNTPENEISENVNESSEQNDSQIKEPDEKNDGSISGTWKHNGTRKFKWELKGKDIILFPGGVGFTIVEQTPDQMVWKNNLAGNYYIVEKQ
ncbi:MAG: hypothetical protein ACR2J3_02045 [Aridibacter sp.]